MKIIILTSLLLSSCSYSVKKPNEIAYPRLPPHVIEINEVPHPFSLNDFNKYIVWVNGKRVQMKHESKNTLIALIGAQNIQPVSNEDMHSGDGWLRPLYPDRKSFELAIDKRYSNFPKSLKNISLPN